MGTRHIASQFVRAARQQLISLIDRFISLLLRERRAQLIAVVVVSVLSGALISSIHSSAMSARRKWTSNVFVLVTTTNIARGEQLTTVNTRSIELPRAVLADDALTSIPRDARTRLALAANTPLTRSLVDAGKNMLDIPDGWRGVALPADAIAPLVDTGDRVDVIARNEVIAQNCLVVESNESRGITIAVPVSEAAIVASAAQSGDVSLVVLNN